ncbi:MAG: RNA methyltransferase [Gemmatimonadota bacterium]|nr:RNA methyltransferase [Gemmatimonadota bacterium]HEU4990234.1 RNA methyltransferase [Gemmatimonadaceae bacterium]
MCEGVRAVEELLRSPIVPRGILVAPQLLDAPRGAALRQAIAQSGAPVEEVAARDFHTAADTDSPQGVLAIAPIPQRSLSDVAAADGLRVLVLDALQDPGNVGTILRTAAALGATATVALPGTVDLWNAKVVRSAMGALFHHTCLSDSWDAVDALRVRTSAQLWVADAAGAPLGERPAPSRLLLVVGNEGAGVSAEARARADHLVALPISPAVESLNVAVAAGILLYELRP